MKKQNGFSFNVTPLLTALLFIFAALGANAQVTCNAAALGKLQYTSGVLQLCDGTNWYNTGATATGYVGIGTTSPSAPLGVKGNISFEGSQANVDGLGLYWYANNNSGWGRITRNSASGNLSIDPQCNDHIVMQTLCGGNVGIGTTAPSVPLHLFSFSHGGDLGIGQQNDATPYMRLGMDTGWTQFLANNAYWTGSAYNYVSTAGYGGTASRFAQVSGTMSFDTASGGTNPITWNNRLFIANNGYIGLNTNAPVNPFTVSSNGYAQVKINAVSGETSSAIDMAASGAASRTWRLISGNDGFFHIYDLTGGASRLNFDTTGNAGIGTTASTAGKLMVVTSGTNQAAIWASSATGHGAYVVTNAGGSSYYGGIFASGSYAANLGRADGYAVVGVGAIWATGAGSFNQSDARLKDHVENLTGALALDKLMQLRPVTYFWKPNSEAGRQIGGDKPQMGLIAQEVKEVFPDIVVLNKNTPSVDRKGMGPSIDKQLKETYGVEYTKLIPVLIASVQELHKTNDALADKNKDLEARIQRLEALMSK